MGKDEIRNEVLEEVAKMIEVHHGYGSIQEEAIAEVIVKNVRSMKTGAVHGWPHALNKGHGSDAHLASLRSHLEWAERQERGLEKISQVVSRYVISPELDRLIGNMLLLLKEEIKETKVDIDINENRGR